MKVCIIAPNFLEPTAWMASAYKTALLLKKQGHDVVVLTSQTKQSKRYEVIEGVRVYRIPAFFIPDPFNYTVTPFLTYYLWKLIKKEKPNIFIVNKYMFYTSLSVIPLKLMGKKVIMQTDTFPGIVWFAPSKILNIFMWIYARTIGWLILKLSNLTIILHERLIPATKKLGLNYRVIHNGVDLKKYNVKPPKDIVKLKGKKKLVLYVGRLDAVKGYDILLRAVHNMKSRDDVHFLFIGGDKNKERLAELDKKFTNATFLGFRKDIPEIMNAADVYVMPSYNEGLPNTLMEAMASKVASVATAVGGIPCLIKNGENGFLVSPGNPKQLQEKIEILLKDKKLRDTFAKKGYERIKEAFSWESIEREWKKLLK